MDVEYAAKRIIEIRKPGKLLFIERVPEPIYEGLVEKIEDGVREEGPLFKIDFPELVRKTNLNCNDDDCLGQFDLQRPTQYRNLIATNCFLFLDDDSYSPEDIWRAYATVKAARQEIWMNYQGRLDGIFVANPNHLLDFRSGFLRKFNPDSQEPVRSDVRIDGELAHRYIDLDIKFAYFRGERLYASSLSSHEIDFNQVPTLEKELK